MFTTEDIPANNFFDLPFLTALFGFTSVLVPSVLSAPYFFCYLYFMLVYILKSTMLVIYFYRYSISSLTIKLSFNLFYFQSLEIYFKTKIAGTKLLLQLNYYKFFNIFRTWGFKIIRNFIKIYCLLHFSGLFMFQSPMSKYIISNSLAKLVLA